MASPNKTLQTVDKALNLLNHFSVEAPEFGLSELAREAGMDKATTLRILNSFAAHGYIEQDLTSKKFRLGPAILRIARIRESTVPLTSIIQPILDQLAATTGETAHASLPDGNALVTIAIADPQRATRVFVDPAQRLPFHATASGIVFLAHSKPAFVKKQLTDATLARLTDLTATSIAEVNQKIEIAKKNGFALADRTFESEVVGIAAPFLDPEGYARGSIAVATVASRSTAETELATSQLVRNAAAEVTRLLGGASSHGVN